MKNSIKRRIERLLEKITGAASSSDDPEESAFRKEAKQNTLSAGSIGRFCRRIPMRIIQFIRPNKASQI